MPTRTVSPTVETRQDAIVGLLDRAVLVGELFRGFRDLRRDDVPQEVAIFERWDKLAEAYLTGLRQLREQAIASVWPER